MKIPVPRRSALGDRVPPVVFTPLLGLFGISLAWRRASLWGAPIGPGDLLLGAVTAIWGFALALYVLKAIRRPGVLAEDAAALPGRAGLASLGMCGFALAAGLADIAPRVAAAILIVALIWHAAFAVMVAGLLLTGPDERRVVSPVFHLTFVGFIVAPLAAAPLGWTLTAQILFDLSLAAAVAVYIASGVQFARSTPPAPLRPLLAIHLAPLAVAGSACAALGWPELSMSFAILATALLVVLAVSVRWLTAAGFLPFWGAFTFPLASYAGLMQLFATSHPLLRLWAAVTLVLASGLVLWIAWRILKLWPGGRLAEMTNAARA